MVVWLLLCVVAFQLGPLQAGRPPVKCGLEFMLCNDGSECVLYNHVCDGESDCRDGSDEVDCAETCTAGQFQCSHGKKCIDQKQVCDGQFQCQDRSDEMSCVKRPEDCTHQCDNRRCLSDKLLCDGENDCVDGSDEANCEEKKNDEAITAGPSPFTSSSSRPNTPSSSINCKLGSKLCTDLTECVHYSHVCDGEADCKDGSDEEGCLTSCETGQFQCSHGKKCIDQKQVCDGQFQCQDRSDEMSCVKRPEEFVSAGRPPVKCGLGFMLCNDGSECVLYNHVCDGESDCRDGSDEVDCAETCTAGQFQCSHGKKCIDQKQVCDGQFQCQDRSDEMSCVKRPEDCTHQCDNNRRCLSDKLLCDGANDCVDGSDEANCEEKKNDEAITAGPSPFTSSSSRPNTPSSSINCKLGSKLCTDLTECVHYSHVCDGEADCKDGSDEEGCLTSCETGQFQCSHGKKCIDQKQVCDGQFQCQDRSDEMSCVKRPEEFVSAGRPPVKCGLGFMLCNDGSECVLYNHVCDGESDCRDGSDEVDCAETCTAGQFQCSHGKKCIDQKQVCDGQFQCQDRSDEMSCVKRPEDCTHQCDNNRRCLSDKLLCDGENDCVDGSDEANCAPPGLMPPPGLPPSAEPLMHGRPTMDFGMEVMKSAAEAATDSSDILYWRMILQLVKQQIQQQQLLDQNLFSVYHYAAQALALKEAQEQAQGVAPRDPQGVAPTDTHGVAPRDPQGVAPTDTHGVAPRDPQGVAPTDTHGVAQRDPQGVAPTDTHGVAQRKGQ